MLAALAVLVLALSPWRRRPKQIAAKLLRELAARARVDAPGPRS
jgi:hypothetical protein